MSATVSRRLGVSPSAALDTEHPGAAIVYSDDEYDALSERLDADPAPSETLRRTLRGDQPATGR